jgi:NDP-sugar pyrophosphorylase family protein
VAIWANSNPIVIPFNRPRTSQLSAGRLRTKIMVLTENVTAVILAGGKGTRLQPYTVSLPKPLMPLGEHPILEVVIKQLRAAGIRKVIICVGYLEALIRAYFGDGSKFGVEITYSSEDEPLGTGAPLTLVKDRLDSTFVFMNGDVFSDVDFYSLIEYHHKRNANATVALSARDVYIDFGVIDVDENDDFLRWNEKPTLQYLVSMGIYVLEPSVISFIPTGFFNIPDLIVKLRESGKPVAGYRHHGYWLDIGRHEDYADACRDVQEKGIEHWICQHQSQ